MAADKGMAFPNEPLVESEAVAVSIWVLRGSAAPSLTVSDEMVEYKSITQSREHLLSFWAIEAERCNSDQSVISSIKAAPRFAFSPEG